jgi:nicotinamide-nucleotide amidase
VILEIINTGSELMLGRVLNTHQQWLCRKLADLGHTVSRQVAIPDIGSDIQQAVKESLGRADLVITTGGLGPTSDDITRDLIARLFNKKLVEDRKSLENIEQFFTSRGRVMPDSVRVQALVPEGAVVLANHHGTAPGLALRLENNPYRTARLSWLIMLPGPPRELRPMFLNSVVPLIQEQFPATTAFVCRTLRSTGLGESLVEQRVAGPLAECVQRGLEIGYCARPGQVDVRLTAQGPQAAALIEEAENVVRQHLGKWIFGTEDESLEATVVRLLTEKNKSVAVAESCTGGFIAHLLTNVPGASATMKGGLITYSNEAKEALAGVAQAEILAQGAVSESVARAMAEGARKALGADYALSATGVAGPGGGSAEKPVGTVFVGFATREGSRAQKFFNPYDRETFKMVTANQALELLRRNLLGLSAA